MFAKYFFILIVFAWSIASPVVAELQEWELLIPNKQTCIAVDLFQGDVYGAFKNDLVAHLSDGSAWKVHPGDTETFSKWRSEDILHVGGRTSFYFFKREHKFALVNHTRNEIVRAMLVQYPEPALKIVSAETLLENSQLVPYTWNDGKGNVYTSYYSRNTYVKHLTLSDGSIYLIREKFDNFSLGDKVYIGINAAKSGFDLLIASGLQRDSLWTYIRKIN